MKVFFQRLWFRLHAAFVVLTTKGFCVGTCNKMHDRKVYMLDLKMNDLIAHHKDLHIFISNLMENAKAQDDALNTVNDILKQKPYEK